MKSFQVAYIPFAGANFHQESAQAVFEASRALLTSLSPSVVGPEKLPLTLDEVTSFLDTINPQFIIVQNVTFTNGAFMSQVIRTFNVPILIWSVREPVIDGSRLRLNSLTGAFSAGNVVKAMSDYGVLYYHGNADEERTKVFFTNVIKAASVKHEMRNMSIASVGHTPQGFGFGRSLDSELMHYFGINLESIESRELMDKARKVSDESAKAYLEEAYKQTVNLGAIDKGNVLAFAKLTIVYQEYVKTNKIKALASRCWPDFFTEYGTPVCAVLGMLNDLGVAASCEADTYGALSMYIGQQLSGKAVFFGDPVSIDESENSFTFWHCGAGACSLAHSSTKAKIGVHPNRKIGPVMDFGCSPSENATVFRISRQTNGEPRFFILKCRALDKPKQFTGTTVVVALDKPARPVLEQAIGEGFEPHFVVIFDDVVEELKALATMLNIDTCIY